MLQALRKRLHNDEDGFTLIELMVVVLIIAILVAIAIPTFLGARGKANDRAAQSDVRNALTAEKTFFTDNQAYTALASELTKIEPALVYTGTAASAVASSNTVYVATTTTTTANDTVTIATQSGSGDCFWLQDVATSGTTYNKVSGACGTAPSSGWQSTTTQGWK